MSKDRREAKRAARRARRLAERAEERARRKEKHAERAAERAERLAERVKRRPQRERGLDQSIEDLVDEVTEKAEAWIDEQTRRLFEASGDDREVRKAASKARRARQEADRARESAKRAGVAADELDEVEVAIGEDDYLDDDFGMDELFDDGRSNRSSRKRKSAKRKARRRERWSQYGGMDWGYDEWGYRPGRRRRRSRSAHLYRDKGRGKICGVCAGTADYFGRPTWEIRLYAVLGLIFIPSVTIPAYFIMYFLMDDKPYYRRVTDRFDESVDRRRRPGNDAGPGKEEVVAEESSPESRENAMSNVQAMKTARNKFADIEQRLRMMESHVTSSQFELRRELKKISGDY